MREVSLYNFKQRNIKYTGVKLCGELDTLGWLSDFVLFFDNRRV